MSSFKIDSNLVPKSVIFDDVYFSPEDGLAETRYVFVEGSRLKSRFETAREMRIAELGFGPGLNFLATVEEFLKISNSDSKLTYMSCELYPLLPAERAAILGDRWNQALPQARPCLEDLLDGEKFEPNHHKPRWIKNEYQAPGGQCVQLQLFLGGVDDFLAQMPSQSVDAWYLDGHSPAKNPEMWTPSVFHAIGRRSVADQTTVATFSAAGHVRRGLVEAGFQVERRKGFGKKRECLAGVYRPATKPSSKDSSSLVPRQTRSSS